MFGDNKNKIKQNCQLLLNESTKNKGEGDSYKEKSTLSLDPSLSKNHQFHKRHINSTLLIQLLHAFA